MNTNPTRPWWQRAACRTEAPELFFRKETEQEAKRICAACPVGLDCLAEALRTRQPHGVWGGLTPAERRALLATRRPAPARPGPRPRRAVGFRVDGRQAAVDERLRTGRKRCPVCTRTKPLDPDFERNATRPDGHGAVCKACRRTARAQRRQAAAA